MVLEAGQRLDVGLRLRNALGVVAGDDVLDVVLKSIPPENLLASLVVEHLLLLCVVAASAR